MNTFLSWLLLLAISGFTYYFYAKPQLPWDSKSGGDRVIVTKGKAVFAGVEEKVEKATNKKKKKAGAKETPKVEKAKQEKPAKQEKAAKQEKPKAEKKTEKKVQKPEPVAQPISSSSSSESDSDEAEEEDPKEAIRRLHALKSGTPINKSEDSSAPKPSKSARGRKGAEKQNLAAPTGASRASSTGADADIDEGDWSRPSGSDPSDMLEQSRGGPRVLNIVPSAQPPKERKQKEKSESPAPGAQSKKNQKKREKAKAAREEELAQLKASREQYRASQKAEEAAKPKPAAPAPAPSDAAWTTVNGKKVTAPKPSAPVSGSALLDTLSARPTSSSGDDDRQNMTYSSYLDQSQWEEIPADVRDETEWSTVPTKGKKSGKTATARDESGANTPAPVEEKKIASRPKPSLATSSATIVRTKSTNGFEALSDDAGTARSSDWAEVEGWEVNPQ